MIVKLPSSLQTLNTCLLDGRLDEMCVVGKSQALFGTGRWRPRVLLNEPVFQREGVDGLFIESFDKLSTRDVPGPVLGVGMQQ